MNLTRENHGQNRRGEVAINAEKTDYQWHLSIFSAQNIACVAHVWRELEGGIEACENEMSASLSCPPDKYSRTLISLKTPATQGTQTGKNATNSKRNERLEAGEKNPVRAFIK